MQIHQMTASGVSMEDVLKLGDRSIFSVFLSSHITAQHNFSHNLSDLPVHRPTGGASSLCHDGCY